MATKTLTITEDAYGRLAALKEEDESFSDVITKITGKVSLLSIAGILTEELFKQIDSEEKEIVLNSMRYAEESPWPSPSVLEEGIFALGGDNATRG